MNTVGSILKPSLILALSAVFCSFSTACTKGCGKKSLPSPEQQEMLEIDQVAKAITQRLRKSGASKELNGGTKLVGVASEGGSAAHITATTQEGRAVFDEAYFYDKGELRLVTISVSYDVDDPADWPPEERRFYFKDGKRLRKQPRGSSEVRRFLERGKLILSIAESGQMDRLRKLDPPAYEGPDVVCENTKCTEQR